MLLSLALSALLLSALSMLLLRVLSTMVRGRSNQPLVEITDATTISGIGPKCSPLSSPFCADANRRKKNKLSLWWWLVCQPEHYRLPRTREAPRNLSDLELEG